MDTTKTPEAIAPGSPPTFGYGHNGHRRCRRHERASRHNWPPRPRAIPSVPSASIFRRRPSSTCAGASRDTLARQGDVADYSQGVQLATIQELRAIGGRNTTGARWRRD